MGVATSSFAEVDLGDDSIKVRFLFIRHIEL